MPIIGSYSPGGPGGSASANEWSTIDELLVQLPDNTANLIQAEDIRDSVYTLWERIGDVENIATSAASSSTGILYSNATPVPITIGGISSGTTFSSRTMQQMWDALLYPYIAPGRALSIAANSSREYGFSTAVTLNWSVTKNTNSITTIIVDGSPQSPTGNSQAGTKPTTATHSTVPVSPSATQTYFMSVGDGSTVQSASTTLTWITRIYWGKIDLSSIENPNLTSNPGSASLCGSLATDSLIQSLDGANANGLAYGTELNSSKNKTYTNINGAGNYLIFAWSSIVAGATSPIFTVNGLASSAFTRIRTNSPFVRNGGGVSGYTGVNYEVWISNTLQNSPLNVQIS